jgi:hypothetical protein
MQFHKSVFDLFGCSSPTLHTSSRRCCWTLDQTGLLGDGAGRATLGNRLPGSLKDQWARASSSVALNLNEGWGRRTKKDRERFFQIALGSIRECQAINDLEPKALPTETGRLLDQFSGIDLSTFALHLPRRRKPGTRGLAPGPIGATPEPDRPSSPSSSSNPPSSSSILARPKQKKKPRLANGQPERIFFTNRTRLGD